MGSLIFLIIATLLIAVAIVALWMLHRVTKAEADEAEKHNSAERERQVRRSAEGTYGYRGPLDLKKVPNVRNAKLIWRGGLAGGTFIVALMWILSSVTVVSASDVGVPITFGKVGQELKSGPHWIAPWTSVETYPKRPKTVDETVVSKVGTSQAGLVDVAVDPRWHINEDRADETWRQTRTSDDAQLEKQIIRPTAISAMQDIINKKDNSQATVRDGFEAEMVRTMQAKLSSYGITIDAVYLRNLAASDEKTKAAIANLAAQQQATKIAIEAGKTAEELKEVQRINAEAAKLAADKLPANLTPAQLTLLLAQIWERQQDAATKAGLPLYTTPSGGAQPNLLVPSPK